MAEQSTSTGKRKNKAPKEGGTETEIMYKYGFELPQFAMFPLLDKRTNDLAKANIELQGQITERKLVEKELSREQQQLSKDLEVAAGIQQSLIPSYSPRIDSIRVAWRFEPCEQIGGDTFNFQYTGRNHISFYLRAGLCGVVKYASAQALDFLDLGQKSSFLDRKHQKMPFFGNGLL